MPFCVGSVFRPCSLGQPKTAAELLDLYKSAYEGEKLIKVTKEAPQVQSIAHQHHVAVGGFTVSEDGQRAVVVATIDNLLKGAATQALQNANLCLGLPEYDGILSNE